MKSRPCINTVTVAAIAGMVCLLVYWRAVSCGFVDYDDPDYILNNPLIRSLDWKMIAQAFRQPHVGWWMPLTWISFAVDYHFWGLDPRGYHLTNIVLHALNTGLVVLIADKSLKSRRGMANSWSGADSCYLYPAILLLAGLIWGIHPLRVESVAWVTERKDVLNGMFALSAVLAYMFYANKKEAGQAAWGTCLLSLALFACSLMAKSITVVLPVLLLLLDRYPLGRLRGETLLPLIKEKVPFFALSALMTFITIRFAGDTSYLVSNAMFPWHERLLVSGNALFQYLRYLVWPAGITPYHAIPDPVPVSLYAVATLAVACLSVLLLWILRARVWIGTVWLLFIIPLLPVLAFIQNGDQGYAARFTYLPAVAPSIMVAALVGACAVSLQKRLVLSRLLFLVVLLLLLCSSAMSYRLITVWDDGGSMWARVIDYAPSLPAYWRRSLYNSATGNNSAVVQDLTAAIKLMTPAWRPHGHNLYAHRGEALIGVGSYAEAVTDLTVAINAYPHPLYFRLRGEALQKLGHLQDAAADFGRAGEERGPLGWYFDNR